MCVSGLALGFTKGWSLAFAMLGIAPIFIIGLIAFTGALKKKVMTQIHAYGQSAGYAEQALSAIRVVVAFGMERQESSNYHRFLDRVRKFGFKADMITGMSLGFFMFAIYFAYSYAFLIGGIWVDKQYWNHANDRPY